MKMPTVADLYAEWWGKVAPPGASALQTRECKRAFYSGVTAMFSAQLEVIGSAGTSEAAAQAWLDRRLAELTNFFEAAAAGGD